MVENNHFLKDRPETKLEMKELRQILKLRNNRSKKDKTS